MVAADQDFLDLLGKSTTLFANRLTDLSMAIIRQAPTERAEAMLSDTIAQTMTLSDLLARRDVLRAFDAALEKAPDPESFAATPIFPRTEFTEALADLVGREPRLATTADLVARIYSEKHGFALARSSSEVLTERVQATVERMIREGKGASRAALAIKEVAKETQDFTQSYAETVYRTNLNTAYSAGRFQQAEDRDIKRVMKALERNAVTDSDLRDGKNSDENHRAAHGLVAATDDPVWEFASPPSGYRCRCWLRLVNRFELERMGLLEGERVLRREPAGFASFRPHPNFGRSRPDRTIYGGGSIAT